MGHGLAFGLEQRAEPAVERADGLLGRVGDRPPAGRAARQGAGVGGEYPEQGPDPVGGVGLPAVREADLGEPVAVGDVPHPGGQVLRPDGEADIRPRWSARGGRRAGRPAGRGRPTPPGAGTPVGTKATAPTARRAGDRDLLDDRPPPATEAFLGWDPDPALDGWEVHRQVLAALDPFRRSAA